MSAEAPSRHALRFVRPALVAMIVTSLALSLSGCGWWVALHNANPGTAASPLQIVAPAKATQLGDFTSTPIDVRLGAGIVVPSVTIDLFNGGLHHALDFAITLGRHAVFTLTPDLLSPGPVQITVSADLQGGGSTTAQTVASYEPDLDVAESAHCDVLGQSLCILPFPNNRFTEPDASTDTGLRVALDPETFPATNTGIPFDPTEWNRNDGFSPGSALVVHVPGVDVTKSKLPTIGDMAAYAAPDAGVVVIDAATGERWPVWAELDAWATGDEPRALLIRPAKNFLEGHRYLVALRNLTDAGGGAIAPTREFQVLRDELPTFVPAVEARRPAIRNVIAGLRAAGIPSSSLDLAWDFTVASERNLSERVLKMRDDAYAQIGSGEPAFTVTSVENEVSSTIWRRVRGTFEVPLYLTGTGAPGSRINYGPDGLPTRNGTFNANFVCNIPRAVYPGTGTTVNPGRALVYGHGLLGSGNEVNGFGPLLDQYEMVACATDSIGMSGGDIGNVAATLQDISKFPSLPDRLQQGMVNYQFLAKLMKDAGGFATNSAFQAGATGLSVIEHGAVFYNGNSQGGILGGALTAISTEWTRAVLGVPAINYSTLLSRSVDWDPFTGLFFTTYPDRLTQMVSYTVLQMLWDRGEGNGYAQHMTDDPLPNTPAHDVLLIEAFGDHQVANIGTETEARTIGARLHTPALAPGRTDLAHPFFGLEPVPSVPYDGSVLVMWDFGTPAPPQANVPPRPPQYGTDPHGKGRAEPRVAQALSDFLRVDGVFTDQCAGLPCQSNV